MSYKLTWHTLLPLVPVDFLKNKEKGKELLSLINHCKYLTNIAYYGKDRFPNKGILFFELLNVFPFLGNDARMCMFVCCLFMFVGYLKAIPNLRFFGSHKTV